MSKNRIIVFFLLLIGIALFAFLNNSRTEGFKSCVNPKTISVSDIEMLDNELKICGSTISSAGYFNGYIHEFKDGNLYIGLKYKLFKSNGSGSFDISIPLKNNSFKKVYLKDDSSTKKIWPKE